VLKHPACKADEDFLDFISRYIANEPGAHRIVALEPNLDQPLSKWFGNDVIFLEKLSHLQAYLRATSLVVSMRYHGVIFASICGLPTIGFSQSKIASLYTETGLQGDYLTSPIQIPAAIQKFSPPQFNGVHKPDLHASFIERIKHIEFLRLFATAGGTYECV
jgi:hypothetical protein